MWLTYTGLSREEAARIGAPTLVVVGDRDEFHPVEEAVRLYRRLPNAEMAVLPGGSHMGPIFEPTGLASVHIDFLDRHCNTRADRRGFGMSGGDGRCAARHGARPRPRQND